ncbi:unnamed protein product, partial [Clonostachys rosea f. rosea IK726]
LLGWVSP